MIPTEYFRYSFLDTAGRRRTSTYRMRAAIAAERYQPEQDARPIPGTREVRNLPETDAELRANHTGELAGPETFNRPKAPGRGSGSGQA